MCQVVFYTYACSHVESVTYRCSKCVYPKDSHCFLRHKSQHTFLEDQLCHDCTERTRQIRQDQQPQSRPQSQLQVRNSQQVSSQTQQPQVRQDSQSSSPNGKGIRPLESNKLANMDCYLEGTLGLTPSDVYRFYARQRK
ncbi:uncharacterized protein CTRU02_213005 [Colletotrichum truncatum]|uniref:Uncharacterized protein n=1 Tax=Colletotrichum truncatum TaxID=5467 RepID=A0ACC3YJN0_COLTU|nr:uncharacterized protein CTRU02_03325 [Colletotrichum truncatum]KAF6797294.1 hypothetical protein CTRU02_03325 [Colletotrichum truncatum]